MVTLTTKLEVYDMSINLDKSKIDIIELLKTLSSNVSTYDLINFYGDSALKREASEIDIFDLADGKKQITIIDNGTIPSDFIVDKGIELNQLKKYCPYIYYTSSISNEFSLSYYQENMINKCVKFNLMRKNKDQINTISAEISDDFLLLKTKSSSSFFAISFVVENIEIYKTFTRKLLHNFTFRYHKLMNKKKLKIISLPERKYYRPFDPLFENCDLTRKGKTIKFRGSFKLDMRYHIIPRSINKEVVNNSCPSKTLDSSSGIFFYNKAGILINRPNFFNIERELNISRNIKEKNIRYVKLEINSIENDIFDEDDIQHIINDKFIRKQIVSLLEEAATKVPQEVKIIEKDHEEEKKKIIINRIDKFFEKNKNKNECIQELTSLFPYESDKKIIMELVNVR